MKADYRTAISTAAGRRFDLVFLDPPYRMLDAYADAIDRLESAGALSDGVVIVAERKGSTQVSYPEAFEVVKKGLKPLGERYAEL